MVGGLPLRLRRLVGFSEMVVSFGSAGSIAVEIGEIQADPHPG
jgi:hypothetical protein